MARINLLQKQVGGAAIIVRFGIKRFQLNGLAEILDCPGLTAPKP